MKMTMKVKMEKLERWKSNIVSIEKDLVVEFVVYFCRFIS